MFINFNGINCTLSHGLRILKWLIKVPYPQEKEPTETDYICIQRLSFNKLCRGCSVGLDEWKGTMPGPTACPADIQQ